MELDYQDPKEQEDDQAQRDHWVVLERQAHLVHKETEEKLEQEAHQENQVQEVVLVGLDHQVEEVVLGQPEPQDQLDSRALQDQMLKEEAEENRV